MGTLIYDADCGFCTTSASWIARKHTFDMQAWQFTDNLDELGLDFEAVTTAAHWVENGRVAASGSDAIGRAMVSRRDWVSVFGYITVNPLVRPVARFVYKRIARNRHRMPGGTAACKMPNA